MFSVDLQPNQARLRSAKAKSTAYSCNFELKCILNDIILVDPIAY
jgi:hypothetical protein